MSLLPKIFYPAGATIILLLLYNFSLLGTPLAMYHALFLSYLVGL
jgi:hypothetical protein